MRTSMTILCSVLVGLLALAASDVRSQDDASSREANASDTAAGAAPAASEVIPAIPAGLEARKEGDVVDLGGRKVTITKLDIVPYVENACTKVCTWEKSDLPELKELREKYKLDEVVAPGKTEFEKQVLLMDWIFKQWKFGHARELVDLRDPAKILEEAQKGHKFQCMHSEVVMRALMLSMGWVSRPMGKPKHTYSEVWSNQYCKWVRMDATSNSYADRGGVPMSTYELRMALMKNDLDGVVGVTKGERKPVDVKFASRWKKISFYMSNVYGTRPAGKVFTVVDEFSDGAYHNWPHPENPMDLYFPINQAALTLVPDAQNLKVTIRTLTPNFDRFQVRIDGKEWADSKDMFTWALHEGENRLEARSVNKLGVEGPVSSVVLTAGK